MIISIGDREFPSKKSATDFVRSILYAYKIGERVTAEHDAFLRDLIDLHPESDLKIGCGISFFTVEQNYGSRGFWLTRTDDTITDWSFLACITPPSRRVEAKRAFRTAIRDQILRFRSELPNAFVCPVSGEQLTRETSHIDHHTPFDWLLSMFLESCDTKLDDVAVTPTADGATDTDLSDPVIRINWQRFHLLTAKLRAVSPRANLSLLRVRTPA